MAKQTTRQMALDKSRPQGSEEWLAETVQLAETALSESPPQAQSGPCPQNMASDQRRLKCISEWRKIILQTRRLTRSRLAFPTVPGSEAEAEQQVAARRLRVTACCEEAEVAYWNQLGRPAMPPGMQFVPFFESKWFLAGECLSCTFQREARRWFRWLCELREVDRAIARTPGRPQPWRDTLKKLKDIQDKFEWADFAWEMYLAVYSGAEPGTKSGTEPGTKSAMELDEQAAVDFLAAWVSERIGEKYLCPLQARSSPAATPSQLRQELLLEVWGGVLAMNAGQLPVLDFCKLPATVSGGVRRLYTDMGDELDGLKPQTYNHVAALTPPLGDPEATALNGERAALLRRHMEALPPQQRYALELVAAGLSRAEMAKEMKCGEESVKEHLKRGRARLRPNLQDL